MVTPVEEIALLKTGQIFGLHFEKLQPPTQQEADERVAELLVADLEREVRNLSPAMTKRLARFSNVARQLISEERADELGLLLMKRWTANMARFRLEDEDGEQA